MADISTETAIIATEAGGELVRDAIVDACRKIAADFLPSVDENDYDGLLSVDEDGNWKAIRYFRLASIAVTSMPDKVAYDAGQNLDLTGLVVEATYRTHHNVLKKIDVTEQCTISPADGTYLDTAGNLTVNISYTDEDQGLTETTSFVVSVEATLQSIYIAREPFIGPTYFSIIVPFDYTGLIVKAVYSDLSEVDVTDECTVDPEEGTYFIGIADNHKAFTVSYEEYGVTKTAVFYRNMAHPRVIRTEVHIYTPPTKTEYVVGEAVDYEGLVLLVDLNYDNYYKANNMYNLNDHLMREDEQSPHGFANIFYYDLAEGTILDTVGTITVSVGVLNIDDPDKEKVIYGTFDITVTEAEEEETEGSTQGE